MTSTTTHRGAEALPRCVVIVRRARACSLSVESAGVLDAESGRGGSEAQGDKGVTVTGQWRAAICVLAVLAVISCAANLAPAEDILQAGTEDERDNVLGRLLNERAPILAFSQRSRREREAESTRPPGKWEEGSEVGALTASREALSSVVGAVRKTVDRIRGRLGGRAASPAPAFIIDKSVSVDELGLLGDSTTPLIVGPWSSEVGFELFGTGFRSCAGPRAIRPRSGPDHRRLSRRRVVMVRRRGLALRRCV